MTADGTYPSPRTGETVSTAAELDALPVDSLVRADGEVYERIEPNRRINGGTETWRCLHDPDNEGYFRNYTAATVISQGATTVLFRPDTPQPATGDAVERASRAYHDKVGSETEDATPWEDESEAYREEMRDDVRCILAAARAGEAEHDPRCISLTDSEFNNHCDCRTLRTLDAAQRGGEAVDREMLSALFDQVVADRRALINTGRADEITVDLSHALADAYLAALGDAAPTVSAEQRDQAARALNPAAWDSPWMQDQYREHARHQVSTMLAALGLEVRD